MKKYFFILAMAMILLSFNACMDFDYISGNYDKGNGDIETYTITVEDFSSIDVRCSGKVYVHKGDEEKVEVKIDKNLYSNLDIDVKDGELVVDLNNATPTVFEVHITSSNIHKIQSFGSADITMDGKFSLSGDFNLEMDGSGDVYIQDISADDINIENNGSGDLKIYGYCDNTYIKLAGSGDCQFLGKAQIAEINLLSSGNLDMRNAENNFATAKLDGSGHLRIKTSGTLSLQIYGSGNAYLYDQPAILNTDIDGSGRVIYMR